MNKLLDELNSTEIDDIVSSVSTAQKIKYLVDGNLWVSDIKDGLKGSRQYNDVYDLTDLLGEDRRIERMYNLLE